MQILVIPSCICAMTVLYSRYQRAKGSAMTFLCIIFIISITLIADGLGVI